MAQITYERGDIVHNDAGDVGVATDRSSVIMMYKHRDGTVGRLYEEINPASLSKSSLVVPMLPADRACLSREQKVAIDAILLSLGLQTVFNLKTAETK